VRKPAPPASVTRDYIFFAARRIAWRDSSGNVYYYFVDAIGSTRAVTNATGTTCFNADYYPYGQENDYNTSCTPTYKFTGYEFDAETGNYYAYARYYSPSLGRFLSADPMGGNISNPQSLNRYAYVLNNPETFIDPLGLCADGQQSVVGSNGEPGCVANPESVVDTVNGGPPPSAPWDYYRFLGEAGPNGCGPYGCPKTPPPDSILYAIAARLAQLQNHPAPPQTGKSPPPPQKCGPDRAKGVGEVIGGVALTAAVTTAVVIAAPEVLAGAAAGSVVEIFWGLPDLAFVAGAGEGGGLYLTFKGIYDLARPAGNCRGAQQ
jgi:RHS repeat-associated protein